MQGLWLKQTRRNCMRCHKLSATTAIRLGRRAHSPHLLLQQCVARARLCQLATSPQQLRLRA